jgi:MFS family permease
MASIGFAAGGLFLIMTGFVIDQQGRKHMLIYGTILTLLSFLSYYFSLGAVFISGIPLLITTIFIMLGDIAPSDARGRYYSILSSIQFHCLSSLFSYPYLLGIAVEIWHWLLKGFLFRETSTN